MDVLFLRAAPVLGPLLMAGKLDFSREHLRTEEAVARLRDLLVHAGESLTALTLSEKGVLRSIPPELARCAQLESLFLIECGLEGESRE